MNLRVVAEVVVSLGDADVEFRVAGHVERFARRGGDPFVAACELVLAGTGHAFHDFGRAGVEGQAGGQHHADGFFRAVGQRETVADAFAVKVHIGLGRDAHVVDFFGSHGRSFEQGKRCIRQAGRASWDFRAGRGPVAGQLARQGFGLADTGEVARRAALPALSCAIDLTKWATS